MTREIVREACFGLYHHLFRAALSMLGISWGIISVVVLLSYGDGFGGALDAGFRGAFSDGTVVAFPGQTSMQAGGERAGKRVRVTADDVLAIGELPLVKNVSPEFMQQFRHHLKLFFPRLYKFHGAFVRLHCYIRRALHQCRFSA